MGLYLLVPRKEQRCPAVSWQHSCALLHIMTGTVHCGCVCLAVGGWVCVGVCVCVAVLWVWVACVGGCVCVGVGCGGGGVCVCVAFVQGYSLSVDSSVTESALRIPFPEASMWYLTLQTLCNNR